MIKMIKRFFSPSRSSYEAKPRSILAGLAFGIIGLLPAIAVVILANSLTVLSDLLRNVGVVFAIFFSLLTVQKGINELKTEQESKISGSQIIIVSTTNSLS